MLDWLVDCGILLGITHKLPRQAYMPLSL